MKILKLFTSVRWFVIIITFIVLLPFALSINYFNNTKINSINQEKRQENIQILSDLIKVIFSENKEDIVLINQEKNEDKYKKIVSKLNNITKEIDYSNLKNIHVVIKKENQWLHFASLKKSYFNLDFPVFEQNLDSYISSSYIDETIFSNKFGSWQKSYRSLNTKEPVVLVIEIKKVDQTSDNYLINIYLIIILIVAIFISFIIRKYIIKNLNEIEFRVNYIDKEKVNIESKLPISYPNEFLNIIDTIKNKSENINNKLTELISKQAKYSKKQEANYKYIKNIKKKNESMNQFLDKLNSISEIIQSIIKIENKDILLKKSLSQNISLVKAEKGIILEKDPISDNFNIVSYENTNTNFSEENILIDLNNNNLEKIVSTKNILNIKEEGFFLTEKFTNAIYYPYLVDDKVNGIVILMDNEQFNFTENDELVFRTLNKLINAVYESFYNRDKEVIDNITELPSEKSFYQMLDIEIKKSQRYSHQLSIVYAEINNYKKIIDLYGEPTYNYVLKKISECINDQIRDTDYPAKSQENGFSVYLPDTSAESAYKFVERFREGINKVDFYDGKKQKFNITLSIGIKNINNDVSSALEFLDEIKDELHNKKSKKDKVFILS